MESPRHQVPPGQVEFGNEFPVKNNSDNFGSSSSSRDRNTFIIKLNLVTNLEEH